MGADARPRLMRSDPLVALAVARVATTPATGSIAFDRENGQFSTLNWGIRSRSMVAIRLTVDSYRENRVKYFDPNAEREINRAPVRPSFEGRTT